MTRRLNPCRTCKPADATGRFSLRRGFTRHKDRICSQCRRSGALVEPVSYKGRAA